MNRRDFNRGLLGLFASLPGLGFLKPVDNAEPEPPTDPQWYSLRFDVIDSHLEGGQVHVTKWKLRSIDRISVPDGWDFGPLNSLPPQKIPYPLPVSLLPLYPDDVDSHA